MVTHRIFPHRCATIKQSPLSVFPFTSSGVKGFSQSSSEWLSIESEALIFLCVRIALCEFARLWTKVLFMEKYMFLIGKKPSYAGK